MKIIIVDDEVLVRKGIMMTIDWEGLGIDEVIEANNGEQALAFILEKDIDIIVTDIKMPKMDGLALIDHLKIHKPQSVVIVLSCVNDMDSVRKALKFGGALDYIPKLSMTTEELVDTLKKAISYVYRVKAYTTKGVVEVLPNFFTLEHDKELRNAIEYESQEDLNKIFEDIKKSAHILQGQWKSSREWEDIVGVFSSLIKKYNVDVNQFFAQYPSIQQIVGEKSCLEEVFKELSKIATAVKQAIEQEKKRQYDPHIYKAIGYIETHYSHPIKLKEVADYVNMSEGYFSKYFKKIMEEPFNDYVNKVKIEKAKALLTTKNLTIQEISEMTGYTNCSYFTQLFREMEGQTPKQYQKSSRKKAASNS